MLIELKGQPDVNMIAVEEDVALMPLERVAWAVARGGLLPRHESCGIRVSDGATEFWICVLHQDIADPPLRQELTDVLQRIIDTLDRAVLAAQGRRSMIVRWDDLVAVAELEPWLERCRVSVEELL